MVGALALGVVATHVGNIQRLARGEEREVVPPVRWKRASEEVDTAAVALAQGPSGGPAPAVWREGDSEVDAAKP